MAVGVEVLGEGAPKCSALMISPAVMSEGARAALVVRTVIEGGAWSSTLAARSLPASMGECPYREGEKICCDCSGFGGDKRTDRAKLARRARSSVQLTSTGPDRQGAFKGKYLHLYGNFCNPTTGVQ